MTEVPREARAGSRLPQCCDPDQPLFLISTAARLAGMHPQTLRTYDRLGLVVPQRAAGRGRRYSRRDVERLRFVQYLSQEEGINLTGVRHILALQAEVERLQKHLNRMMEECRSLRTTPDPRVFAASPADGVWLHSRRLELLA
ncbi:MAG: helix-turn-helix transcriptional regulator [Propionibacteriaceae bacterium]|jgi:MerR family transcriptional regulator/heat shock protein HspR|nr:helix-turn-helix transcriptional regulator [Propionibacteriaceae bacterium]